MKELIKQLKGLKSILMQCNIEFDHLQNYLDIINDAVEALETQEKYIEPFEEEME